VSAAGEETLSGSSC